MSIMSAWTSGHSRRGSHVAIGVIAGLVWVLCMGTSAMWSSESHAADPARNDSFVGWNEVQSAFGHRAVASSRLGPTGAKASSLPAPTVRRTSGEFAIQRVGAALPPPPRGGLTAATLNVHPSSLAGISSSVIPAVTGDLYWSRPSLDMRVIGQSIGQPASLQLSRPSVGVSVGSTVNTPPFVGIK